MYKKNIDNKTDIKILTARGYKIAQLSSILADKT